MAVLSGIIYLVPSSCFCWYWSSGQTDSRDTKRYSNSWWRTEKLDTVRRWLWVMRICHSELFRLLLELMWDTFTFSDSWTGDWRACLAHQGPVVTRDPKRTLFRKTYPYKCTMINSHFQTTGSGIRSFWCFHGPHSLPYVLFSSIFPDDLPLKLKVQIEIWGDQRQNPTVHSSMKTAENRIWSFMTCHW